MLIKHAKSTVFSCVCGAADSCFSEAACHAQELRYVFHVGRFTDEEDLMSTTLNRHWASFASGAANARRTWRQAGDGLTGDERKWAGPPTPGARCRRNQRRSAAGLADVG